MGNNDTANSWDAIKFTCVRSVVYLSFFFLSLYFYVDFSKSVDLHLHIGIIEKLDQGKLVAPHFLYHLVVYGISKISHISFYDASCFVLASCLVLSAIVIEDMLRFFLKDGYSDYFLLFVSLALMFVSAIYFPLINKYPYKGIWSPNPWHNPTFLAAKPFVLLIFWWYILEITKDRGFEKRFSLIRISILLMICALIKPNFVLAFIPSSFIFCFFLPDKKIFMFSKTVQLLLPVLAVIVFQFLFTYYYDVSGSSSIRFCFFDTWQFYARSVPLAVIQATAFPLVILIVLLPRLSEDKALVFSWILFIVSLLIFGLLCETGVRKNHGNFAWTYMSCLNILFVYSTIVFLRWVSDIPKNARFFQIKTFLCGSVFLFHLLSGLYYVGYLISGYSN